VLAFARSGCEQAAGLTWLLALANDLQSINSSDDRREGRPVDAECLGNLRDVPKEYLGPWPQTKLQTRPILRRDSQLFSQTTSSWCFQVFVLCQHPPEELWPCLSPLGSALE
jgi:hypothetical protein